jgi:hypothetical protein
MRDRVRTGEEANVTGHGLTRSGTVVSDVLNALRDPVVVILLLAGFFDGISGNPIHSILLISTAVVLGRDRMVHRDGPGRADAERIEALPAPAASSPKRLLAIPAVAYAIVVGAFGRYSWPATVAVVVPGAAALIIAWRDSAVPRPVGPPIERAGAVAWASVFVAAGLWELTALLLQPSLTTDSPAHPTISVLTDPLLATHPGRSLVLLLWLGVGFYLMRR